MPGSGFWIAAAAALIAAMAAAACSYVSCRGTIQRKGSDDYGEIEIRALFGLIRYEALMNQADWSWSAVELVLSREQHGTGVASSDQQGESHTDKSTIEQFYARFSAMLRLTFHLTELAKRLIAKVQLTEWEWTTSIGTRDAVWTAIATGAAWSIQSTVTGVLSRHLRLCTPPVLQVTPKFNSSIFDTRLQFAARIRAIHLILAGIGMIGRIMRVRGGLSGWIDLLVKSKPQRA